MWNPCPPGSSPPNLAIISTPCAVCRKVTDPIAVPSTPAISARASAPTSEAATAKLGSSPSSLSSPHAPSTSPKTAKPPITKTNRDFFIPTTSYPYLGNSCLKTLANLFFNTGFMIRYCPPPPPGSNNPHPLASSPSSHPVFGDEFFVGHYGDAEVSG